MTYNFDSQFYTHTIYANVILTSHLYLQASKPRQQKYVAATLTIASLGAC